ncbi:hypothetical protein GCM10020256_70200 [Streptomyces thermocoprophilus]
MPRAPRPRVRDREYAPAEHASTLPSTRVRSGKNGAYAAATRTLPNQRSSRTSAPPAPRSTAAPAAARIPPYPTHGPRPLGYAWPDPARAAGARAAYTTAATSQG